ncbi:MAG: type IX secretion system protein PorQ [Cyclobacteriaceae bacterium]
MNKEIGISLILLLAPLMLLAQVSGRYNFDFVDVAGNARVAALGGHNISLVSEDVNLFFGNPALINQEMMGSIGLNHAWLMADIGMSSVAYATEVKNGMWAAGLQYLNYGSIPGYDENGMTTGNFQAREYVVALGRSHAIGPYRLGVNLKYAGSAIGGYNAGMLLFDLGGLYTSPSGNFTAGLLLNNYGFLINEYTGVSNTRLPLDVKAGITVKPEHMPARFSVTLYNLARATSVDKKNSNNDVNGVVNKLMSHMTLGTEILISKNFNLRAGYNHLINQELSLENASGGAGFSFGFMLKIKGFELAYTRSIYHLSGGINYLTLNTNLNFFKKRISKES